MIKKYQPAKIEKKWQDYWEKTKLFQANDFDKTKKKFYHLVMFPYPSGDLHIGHWYIYAPSDTYARFKFLQGYNVLSPIGFDAFGLPAENAAIKHNLHPRDWTEQNIKQMTRQLKSMGPMYDWTRVISTIDPNYYKWTQWMFLQLYKKGLVYRKKQAANWCRSCQTVLANEQVVGGECERCGSKIEIREIEQWLFKITDYADRLLNDLEKLDWPEKTKIMQRNWIGRSNGIEIEFAVKNHESKIKVFTTRPDTIFGATYLVLAPEHPLVKKITSKQHRASVDAYIEQSKHKTELQRKEEITRKTGVFTGSYAVNPANNQEIPIWVADYVLMSYGTGAIMAVPAHDQRDLEFAIKFKLPIIRVIENEIGRSLGKTTNSNFQASNHLLKRAYEGEGNLINSNQFDNLPSGEARIRITDWLVSLGKARKTIQYRLRDWLVSRQRYWGAPIPMIHCQTCGLVPVPEEQLPVTLPDIKDYIPKGKPPLATAEGWINVKCPQCNGQAKREAETMDTFVDSSWYFLRYPDPNNERSFCDRKLLNYWCPTDIYIGGAEHTVLHLLYARFFTKVLFDLGYLNFDEPFPVLRHQGTILGTDRQKMSKSRGNVVDPDQLVAQFGSDIVRMTLMFMGPYDQGGPWIPDRIRGIKRYIDKVWKIAHQEFSSQPTELITKIIHKTIDRVTKDLEQLHFNTAIASLMELLNAIEKSNCTKEQFMIFIQLLSPFAPHVSEELWERLGNVKSVFQAPWPQPDPKYLEEKHIIIAVAINGKTRGTIKVEQAEDQESVEKKVRDDLRLKSYLDNRTINRIVYIPSKIINFVVQ